ncbi:MAG: MBL fold metallo-hydrolase [Phycisphaerales bacterium]|nr:MBL fold metallo-hydrolase [Phycisphaerales bacterium]
MRFMFLGTGTSAGVPTIGCGCEVCRSHDPRDRRLRSAGALRFVDAGGVERVLLIDCGPDLRQQALAHGIGRCDAVLFTHNHVDHTWGVDELRRFNAVMQKPIDIYAELHTLEFLRRVYMHIFSRDKNVNDSFVATLVPHMIEPDLPLVLHGVRVTPVRLLHGRLPIVGFRFDHLGPAPAGSPLPLAYCTDVSGIPPESWPLLAGLRTLVLGALRHRRHPTHFTVEQALRAAEQMGATATYFIHMSHDLAHAATQADLPPGVFLAHDGLVLGEG